MPPEHSHDGITRDDATLRTHVVDIHGLDVPGYLSAATEQGLHDRLHGRTKAVDD